MSTIQVDRIIPYQSSSVTIEGDVTVLGAATTGSNIFTGDQNIQGTLTASIQEGYVLAGGAGDISVLVATSSFIEATADLGPLNTFTASQEVLNTTFATTGSNTFVGDQNIQGTLTASIQEGYVLAGGVGNISTLVATSSFGEALPSGVISGSTQISGLGFATTGSNTFNGNQTVNGVSSQTFNAPTNGNQSNIITLNGVNIGGTPYDNVSMNIQDYGGNYEDVFITEFWDSFAYNYGSEFLLNGKRVSFSTTASGSGANRGGGFLIRDLGTAQTEVNMYGQFLRIGAGTITTDSIIIGHPALPLTTLTATSIELSGSVDVSGSVDISQVLTLAALDPLPANGVGQLAVSGSNLYYNDGSTWSQIN
jgi:hypothetical protein